jgi:DNA-directed RNA polymerase subunit RPC12/RpoP
MNLLFVKRGRKITGLVVVSSIIGLSLMSLLPWISVTETPSADETITVYHNFATMEMSDDEQIKEIVKDLRLISNCFWLVIIFGLLSFAGIIIYTSKKYSSLAQIIMLIGCATIIFSVLAVFVNWNLINNIKNMEAISASLIFKSGPIMYAQLPLIMGVISLIGAALYAVVATSFSIKYLISSKKEKKSGKKQYDQKTKPEQFSKKEEEIVIKKTPIEEKQELLEQIQTIEKPVTPKQSFAPEKPSDIEEILEKPILEEQPLKPETSPEIVQKQSQESEQSPTSLLFEKALSSAIEKRQMETDKKKLDKNLQLVKKKINVQCSQCKHVFTVEKEEDTTRIECPKCGKKGIVKQQ